MREAPDSELMSRYAHGSEAAFVELFRRYEGRAYGYFRKRVHSEAEAWDLYQELFLRLHRFRQTYDPAEPFAPWFFQVAYHVLIDARRRSFRSREVPLDGCSDASPTESAEVRTMAREEAERRLRDLSPEEGQIVIGAKVVGLAYAEVAERLGKSTDAVKQAASRALRRLRLAAASAK